MNTENHQDYAVAAISQYVWRGSPAPLWRKIHKLTLHGGFGCPNRDGTLGRGGCTFCNVASFADEAMQRQSIGEQLAQQAARVDRARRYLAYFQAYTSTYAEVERLEAMYRQALAQSAMVGLCVGTGRTACRPPRWIC